jgi:hypothetical protein
MSQLSIGDRQTHCGMELLVYEMDMSLFETTTKVTVNNGQTASF